MSVRALTRVWQQSQAKGGDLLVLLAIADFANDTGDAYPSIRTLAIKSRLAERNVQRAIRRLQRSGELSINPGEGPHGTHLYQVTICQVSKRQGDNLTDDICDREGVTPASPNPSYRTVSKSLSTPRGDNLSGEIQERFDRFWAAYPRKEGKGACRRWWNAHNPDGALLDRMLAKIEAAKLTAKWREQGGKFIPMPYTWLNQERWTDEYPLPSHPKPPRIPL